MPNRRSVQIQLMDSLCPLCLSQATRYTTVSTTRTQTRKRGTGAIHHPIADPRSKNDTAAIEGRPLHFGYCTSCKDAHCAGSLRLCATWLTMAPTLAPGPLSPLTPRVRPSEAHARVARTASLAKGRARRKVCTTTR